MSMPWRDKVRFVTPLAVLMVLRRPAARGGDPVPDVTEKIERARAAYEAWLAAQRRDEKD